ncbi:cyclin-G2-like [Anthonomus grandis grandis]|uniref:cyclin-G2-like n=1 Tax=Anthonomus grandis grandis TaxID=2921223 RepID=UPI0021656CF8|nr:cyclin-G2-like [Anthonomus grandis grandis]
MVKRRGWPCRDAVLLKPLVFNLEEGLQIEKVFRPNLSLIQQKPGEVTLASRDGAIDLLRFLRMWLELPHSVFFSAVSYLDMFLAKMRVQEKFLKCVTISCLYLAMENDKVKCDMNHLVKISQSECTARDVERMMNIIKEKIKTEPGDEIVTPADFLQIYIDIFQCVTEKWEHFVNKEVTEIKERMLILIEVLLSNSSTAYIRSSVMALIVFHSEVEKIMAQGLPNKSVFYLGEVLQFLSVIREIQLKCKIKNTELKLSYLQISKILRQYDSQEKNKKVGQKLTWNFSLKTIRRSLKRLHYRPNFQTIQE